MAINRKNSNDNIIDITKFFSRDNEENGKWYQPKVKGKECGIEFKIYGPNSNAQSVADDKFNKEKEEIDMIEDSVEKEERYKEALAKKLAAYCGDIRGANGAKLSLGDDKEVTKKDIYDIFVNSPVIALDVMRYAARQENFLD